MSTSVASPPTMPVPCEVADGEVLMPDDLRAVALEELREDDLVREQALQQLRDWISKHPAIKRCRTDAPFLLRFLRTKKFSVPQACAMLEKYLTVRQMYPQWFQKLDINDPSMEAIMDSGYLVPLLKRDANNRQIILSCAGRFDPYKFTSEQMARAHGLVCEALMDDQLNQVYGYTYINDESGLLMGHVSLWSLTDIKAIMGCIQNSTPMRHKETHFVNIPSYANQLVVFAVSVLSEKLKNRIMLHKTADEMKEKIDPSILPKEYGGEVPMADMIASLKKRLRDCRESVLALDDMFIDIDSTIKLDSDMKDELGTGVIGSFRKLQVD